MKVDLVVRNARIVTHDGEFHGGVAVQDGKIALTGADDALPPATREIDAGGRVLMPGVIDPHTHLGVNYPFDEDMRTETAAAAAGGLTTVLLYIRNKAGLDSIIAHAWTDKLGNPWSVDSMAFRPSGIG